ncbi:hypothetical protein GWN63_06510 [Candidatus Bathyarchaeota archaeon]|nr:hypothetical protein [Candidatus Bathyarchaeota archaeon]NIU81870.1 hypothetical protein [Candidatus Bathyarchaeota archaeon]NIV68503.1 hypothetical protein [Candidatus Bathyarchaeota archaeon]NIW16798.1 hypothetical protein [Candidatus Bathyarchaeota archaeon]
MVEAIDVGEQASRCRKKGSLLDLLLEVIDDTLKHIFREGGARVIYNTLEDRFQLKQEDIGEKPHVFSAGLEELLGSGAPVIERLILKELNSRLQLNFREKKGYGFADYIEELEKGAIIRA